MLFAIYVCRYYPLPVLDDETRLDKVGKVSHYSTNHRVEYETEKQDGFQERLEE